MLYADYWEIWADLLEEVAEWEAYEADLEDGGPWG